MLLVILGAGASYDSDPRWPPPHQDGRPAPLPISGSNHRPPLATELFDERFGYAISLFPQCRPLIHRLRLVAEDGGSVESQLSAFEAETATYPMRKVHLAAIRSYLRRIIADVQNHWMTECDGVTNYAELVDRLEPSFAVCYVTFNYDTLLERGITDATRRKYAGIADHVTPRPIVIKPHGSITWSQRVQVPSDYFDEILAGGTPDEYERRLIDKVLEVTELDTINDYGVYYPVTKGPPRF
jgi:hypothetical protein